MRVLHLPIIIVNQAYEMSHALRLAGVESDYAVFNMNDGWLLPGKPDYNLNVDKGGPYFKSNIRKISLFLAKAIFKYDVFHYHSNIPLLFNYFDPKLLKMLGKKIIVSYWGCDVRTKAKNLKLKYSSCSDCHLFCVEDYKQNGLTQFKKYADLRIASMPELLEYVPGAIYFPAFVDDSLWSPRPKSLGKKVKILHPVGNSKIRADAKGTKSILAAVERLQKENFPVELLNISQVTNCKMKDYYAQSDLVIEQLRCGWHGVTALEAMSMAKPVIAYIRPELEKYEPNLPIINANPDTIYKVLKDLLKNPKDLQEIGLKSRAFIEKERSLKMMGEKLHQLYKSLY